MASSRSKAACACLGASQTRLMQQSRNGSVVVVTVNGEYTVKRLRRGPDCVWLDPANPKYQPICVSIGEELHVLGVVNHAIHTMR